MQWATVVYKGLKAAQPYLGAQKATCSLLEGKTVVAHPALQLIRVKHIAEMAGPSTGDRENFNFPPEEIACKGYTRDELKDYYSLTRNFGDQCAAGTFWDVQKTAFYRCLRTHIPAGSGFKKNSLQNLNEKYKSLDEGAGMAYKFLNATPASFDFVMHPDQVARLLGIYRAKGNVTPATMKKLLDHWRVVSDFVGTEYCPRDINGTCYAYSKAYREKLDVWYGDMSKKLKDEKDVLLKRKIPEEERPVHLFEVWEHAKSQWLAWCKKYKVGGQFPSTCTLSST